MVQERNRNPDNPNLLIRRDSIDPEPLETENRQLLAEDEKDNQLG